jgi:hypothetical protein
MWKVGEKKEEVPAPITLPPLDEQLQTELHQRYEEAPDAETRTRYQMIILAQLGQPVSQIARLVLRSEDTVARVLNRFEAGRAERSSATNLTRPGAHHHVGLGSRVGACD